jgi:Cys-rich repeat protein
VCRNSYASCDEGSGLCHECASDAHCTGEDKRCDAEQRCVQCLSDADCGGGSCDSGGRCSCTSDAECSGAAGLGHCGLDDRCGCLADGECSSGAPTSIGHCSVDE